MYYCPKCRKPLSEFDVAFNEKLFRETDLNNYKCFDCHAGKRATAAFAILSDRQARVKYCIFNVILLVSLVILAAFIAALASASQVLGGIMAAVLIISWWALVLTNNARLVESFNLQKPEERYETGYHYESEFTSDGKISTKKVTDYSTYGGGGCFVSAVLFVTAFFWSVPYIIYVYASRDSFLSKHVPISIINAYDAAKAEIPPVKDDGLPEIMRIHSKFIVVKNMQKVKEKLSRANNRYESKLSKAYDKYSVFGYDAINEEQSKIILPSTPLNINGKTYLAIRDGSFNSKTYLLFLLYRSDDGEICGKMTIGDDNNHYYVFMDPDESLTDMSAYWEHIDHQWYSDKYKSKYSFTKAVEYFRQQL